MILLVNKISYLCISMYEAHVFLKTVHEDLSVYDPYRLLKLSLFFEHVMRLLPLKILSHLCISMYKAHVLLKGVHEDLSVIDHHRL